MFVVRSKSSKDELSVSGTVINKVVISVELSKDDEIVIPVSESITILSAVTVVDNGIVESSRSDVNKTAQRMFGQ